MVTAGAVDADAVDRARTSVKTVAEGDSWRCSYCCLSCLSPLRVHQPMLRRWSPSSWASRPVATAAEEFPVWKQSLCRTVGDVCGGEGPRQAVISSNDKIKGQSVKKVSRIYCKHSCEHTNTDNTQAQVVNLMMMMIELNGKSEDDQVENEGISEEQRSRGFW